MGLGLVAAFAAALAAQPGPAAVQHEGGERLARVNCGACHAVGRAGASPMAAAPPFRELHRLYPVESLAEALAEGIRSGHPAMPEVRFEAAEVEALITYLKSLETVPAR